MSYNESLNSHSNYPPMSQSDWDSAPWNLPDPEERDFDVTVSYTLSKEDTITTTAYDDYTHPEYTGGVEGYEEAAWGLPDLLKACQRMAQHFIDAKDFSLYPKSTLKHIAEGAQGWVIDDSDIVEEEK